MGSLQTTIEKSSGRKKSIGIKPFVKWAGGKTQLIPIIEERLPEGFGKKINKYAEPFVGGGAVLFHILCKYKLDDVYISDINKELIITYSEIKDNPSRLIKKLYSLEEEYCPLDHEARKILYSKNRDRYNEIVTNKLRRKTEIAALFICLNKTCFNGLYRVNGKGEFNVPIGNYNNPLICDEDNILKISDILQNVNIVRDDYKKSIDFIDNRTFAYFDPPYRPLTETANFTSYSRMDFNDKSQIELAKFADELDKVGAKILLSNSDPKNSNPDDNFFDDIYKGFNIVRIPASRMINSNGAKRGKINELLIANYEVKPWMNCQNL